MRGRGPFDSGQGRSAPHLHDYVDARFPVGFYLADLDGWDSSLVQGMGQGFAFGGGDQETSGGLGIVEDGAEVFGNLLVVFDQAFGEVAVVGQASGDVAGVDAVQCAGQEGNFGRFDCDGHVGGQDDFSGVADQAEAGDIG